MKRTMTAAIALSFVATAALAQDGGPRHRGGGEGRGRPQQSQGDAQAQPQAQPQSRGGERGGPRQGGPPARAEKSPAQPAAAPAPAPQVVERRAPPERPQAVNPRNGPPAREEAVAVQPPPRPRGFIGDTVGRVQDQQRRAEQQQQQTQQQGQWSRGDRPSSGDRGAQDRNGDGRPDRSAGDRSNWDRNGDGRPDGNRTWDRNGDGRSDGDREGWNRDGGRGGWDRDHRGPAQRPTWARPDGRHDRDYGRPRYDVRRFPHFFPVTHRYRLSNYYVQPYGYYDYAWGYGDFLPWGWYGPSYWIDDWFAYGLPVPPIGCEWVRVGRDAVLVDTFTGRVVSVARLLFW